MSLSLAIKRSYRYFIPPSLFEPRKLVRDLYTPMVFYVIGLATGMDLYARPGEIERITTISIAAMLAVLALKWWSGVGQDAL